ncbi:hypothetical protein HCQ94_01610 [Actinomyces sp. zg-332]|nr:hypothetical protein HCQ94_01610 [Actinomyces sp. zg-332]
MFLLLATVILSWVDLIPMKYETRLKVYKVKSFLDKFVIPITGKIDKVVKPIEIGEIRLSLSTVILFFMVMLLDSFVIYLVGLYASWRYGVSF